MKIITTTIKNILQWLWWCVDFKTIMPWSVHLVSMRGLTEEEYNYPSECELPKEFLTDSYYHTHHIFCNQDPRVPPEKCWQCIDAFEKHPYPKGSYTGKHE